MKVSTRGRYGLRAMLELTRRFGESPVLMSALAEKEGLSRKYLHALLSGLKSAGLVRSIRGTGGGFILAKPPSQIPLSDVLHALEGPFSLVDCVADTGACAKTARCTARRVWRELSEAIEEVLARVTLEDLVASEDAGGPQLGVKPPGGSKRRSKGRKTSRAASRADEAKAERKCP